MALSCQFYHPDAISALLWVDSELLLPSYGRHNILIVPNIIAFDTWKLPNILLGFFMISLRLVEFMQRCQLPEDTLRLNTKVFIRCTFAGKGLLLLGICSELCTSVRTKS